MMKKCVKYLALLSAILLLLGGASCAGGSQKEFPMWSTKLSELRADELIRRIAEITGAAEDEIFVPRDSAFSSHNVTADFDWQGVAIVELVYYKRGLSGEKTYRSQLHISPDDSRFWLTKPYQTETQAERPEQIYYTLRDYLEALQYLPQEQIRSLEPARPDGVYSIAIENPLIHDGIYDGAFTDGQPCIFYSKSGVTENRDWQVRIDVLPMYRDESEYDTYAGVGEDRIHLFYVAGEE